MLAFLPVNLQAGTVWESGHHEIFDVEVYGELDIYNDVTLDIFGGDILRLAAFDTTITDWHDGTMDVLWVNDNSIVNIYGGSLEEMAAIENGQINLYAYDIVHTTTGGHYGIGQVMGYYYSDNSYFCFDLGNLETYSRINIIPEPSTLILISLGLLFLRKR
ncbi:MAG: PEP-CTERM sorting domain-containing protein [Phycisphaerae bacterium]|nr:PEP-CTERM sorting domain-containing protein [Phycisphaerae bacterium]